MDKNRDDIRDETSQDEIRLRLCYLVPISVKNPSYKGDDDWMETEKDIFKDMDMNGDGYLNGDELILWIQQDNGEIAVDEAIHLIETADKDEDGKLSHDEVMEAMEDFIESDATEYGFMLKHDEL